MLVSEINKKLKMNKTLLQPVGEIATAAADASGDMSAARPASPSSITISQSISTTLTDSIPSMQDDAATSHATCMQDQPAGAFRSDDVDLAKKQLNTLSQQPAQKRFIQKITVIDTKKLQQLGLDRRIAEALSKQKLSVKREAKTKSAVATVTTPDAPLDISNLTPAERLAHAKKLLNQKLLAIVPSTSKAAAATASIKLEKEKPLVYKSLPVLPTKTPQEIARVLDFSSSTKKPKKFDINAPQFVHNFHLSQKQTLRTSAATAEKQGQQMLYREKVPKPHLDNKTKCGELTEHEQQMGSNKQSTTTKMKQQTKSISPQQQKPEKQQQFHQKDRKKFLAQVRASNRAKCEAYERRMQLEMELEQPQYEHLPQKLNEEYATAKQTLQKCLREQELPQLNLQEQEELRKLQEQQRKILLNKRLQFQQEYQKQLQEKKQQLKKNVQSYLQIFDEEKEIKPSLQLQQSKIQLQPQSLPQLQIQQQSDYKSQTKLQLQPKLLLQPQPQPISQPHLQLQLQPQPQPQSTLLEQTLMQSKTKLQMQPLSKLLEQTQSQQKLQLQPQQQLQSKLLEQTLTQSQPKQQPKLKIQPQLQPESQPHLQPQQQLQTQSKLLEQTQSQPKLQLQPQIQLQPQPQLQPKLLLQPKLQLQPQPLPKSQLKLHLQLQLQQQKQSKLLEQPLTQLQSNQQSQSPFQPQPQSHSNLMEQTLKQPQLKQQQHQPHPQPKQQSLQPQLQQQVQPPLKEQPQPQTQEQYYQASQQQSYQNSQTKPEIGTLAQLKVKLPLQREQQIQSELQLQLQEKSQPKLNENLVSRLLLETQEKQKPKVELKPNSTRKSKIKAQLLPQTLSQPQSQPQPELQLKTLSQPQLQHQPQPHPQPQQHEQQQQQQQQQQSQQTQSSSQPPPQLQVQTPPQPSAIPPPSLPSQQHHSISKDHARPAQSHPTSHIIRNSLTYEGIFEKFNRENYKLNNATHSEAIIPKASIRPVTTVPRKYSKKNTSSFPPVSPLKNAFGATTLPEEAPLPQISTLKKPFTLQKPSVTVPKNITITIADDLTYTIKPHPLNLIVLEDKVLTQDEKIDLTLFGLAKPKLEPDTESPTTATDTTFVETEEQVVQQAELPAIGATISTDPQQNLVVVNATQPKKFIIAPDKLKLSKDKIAALAKQIKSQALQQTTPTSKTPQLQTKMCRSGSVIQLQTSLKAEDNRSIQVVLPAIAEVKVMPTITPTQTFPAKMPASPTIDTIQTKPMPQPEQQQQNVRKIGKIVKLEPRQQTQNISNEAFLETVNVGETATKVEQKPNMPSPQPAIIYPYVAKTAAELEQTKAQPKIIKIESAQTSELIVPKPVIETKTAAIEDKEIIMPNVFDASTSSAACFGKNLTSAVCFLNDTESDASMLSAVDFIAALGGSTNFTDSSPFELSAEEMNLKATLGMSGSPMKLEPFTAPSTKRITKSVDSIAAGFKSLDATALFTHMFSNDDFEKNITNEGKTQNQENSQTKHIFDHIKTEEKQQDLNINTYGYLSLQNNAIPGHNNYQFLENGPDDYKNSRQKLIENKTDDGSYKNVASTASPVEVLPIVQNLVLKFDKSEAGSIRQQAKKELSEFKTTALKPSMNCQRKVTSEFETKKEEQEGFLNYKTQDHSNKNDAKMECEENQLLNSEVNKYAAVDPKEKLLKANKRAPRFKKGKINLLPRKKNVSAKGEPFEIPSKSIHPISEGARLDESTIEHAINFDNESIKASSKDEKTVETGHTDAAEESQRKVLAVDVVSKVTKHQINKDNTRELENNAHTPLSLTVTKDSKDRNIDSCLHLDKIKTVEETPSLQPFNNNIFLTHTKVSIEKNKESPLQPNEIKSSDKMPSQQSFAGKSFRMDTAESVELNNDSDELGLTPHAALDILQGTSQHLKSMSITMKKQTKRISNVLDAKEQKAKETEAAQILVSLIQPPPEIAEEQLLPAAKNPFKKKLLEIKKNSEKVIGIQTLLKQIEDSQLQQNTKEEIRTTINEKGNAESAIIGYSGQEIVPSKQDITELNIGEKTIVEEAVQSAVLDIKSNDHEDKKLRIEVLRDKEKQVTKLEQSFSKSDTINSKLDDDRTKHILEHKSDLIHEVSMIAQNTQPAKSRTRRSKSRTVECEIASAENENIPKSPATKSVAANTQPISKVEEIESKTILILKESVDIKHTLSVESENEGESKSKSKPETRQTRQTRHSESTSVDRFLMENTEAEKVTVDSGVDDLTAAKVSETLTAKVVQGQKRRSKSKSVERDVMGSSEDSKAKAVYGKDDTKETSCVSIKIKTETKIEKAEKRNTRSSESKTTELDSISAVGQADGKAEAASEVDVVKNSSGTDIKNKTELTTKLEERQTRRSKSRTIERDLKSTSKGVNTEIVSIKNDPEPVIAGEKLTAKNEKSQICPSKPNTVQEISPTNTQENKTDEILPGNVDKRRKRSAQTKTVEENVPSKIEDKKAEADFDIVCGKADKVGKIAMEDIKNQKETSIPIDEKTQCSKSKTVEKDLISFIQGNNNEAVSAVNYEVGKIAVKDIKNQKETSIPIDDKTQCSKSKTVEMDLISSIEGNKNEAVSALNDTVKTLEGENRNKREIFTPKVKKRGSESKAADKNLKIKISIETDDNAAEDGETVAKRRRTCSLVSFETSFVSQEISNEPEKLENKQPETVNPSSLTELDKEQNQPSVSGVNLAIAACIKPTLGTYTKPRLESKQSTADTQSDIDITDIDYSTREDSNDDDETAKEESLQESKINKASRKRLRKTIDDIKKGRAAEIQTDDTDSDDGYDGDCNEFLGFDEILLRNAQNAEETARKSIAATESPKETVKQIKQDDDVAVLSCAEKLHTKRLKDWLTTGKAGQPPLAKSAAKTHIKMGTKTMPLKKRWELAQQRPIIETDITDDTSPAHDDDDDDEEEIAEESVKKRQIDSDEKNSENTTVKRPKLVEKSLVGTEHVFVRPQIKTTPAMLNVNMSANDTVQSSMIAAQSTEAVQADALMPEWSNLLTEPANKEKANTGTSSTLPKKRGRKPVNTTSYTEAESTEAVELNQVGEKISPELLDRTLAITSLPKKRSRKTASKVETNIGTPKLLSEAQPSAELVVAIKAEPDATHFVAEPSQTEAADIIARTPLPKKRGRKPKLSTTPQETKKLSDKVLAETPGTSLEATTADILLPTKRRRKPMRFFEDIVTTTQTSTPSKSTTFLARTMSATDIEASINDKIASLAGNSAAGPRKRGRKPKGLSVASSSLNETKVSEQNTVIAEAPDATSEPQSTKNSFEQQCCWGQSKAATVQDPLITMDKSNKPKSIIEIFTSSISTNPKKSQRRNKMLGDALRNSLIEAPGNTSNNTLDDTFNDTLNNTLGNKLSATSNSQAKFDDLSLKTSVEMQDNVPLASKKVGRKPANPKTVEPNTTQFTDEADQSAVSTDVTHFVEGSIYPRILLIRNREQLYNNEPLAIDSGHPPPGYVKCALCLGNAEGKKWLQHLSEHYGVGWVLGKTALNVSTRASVLSIVLNYFKNTNVKGLICRLCQRLYRSGLGLITHLESCGVSAAEQKKKRIMCEYCKHSYTPLSFKVHTRVCSARLALERNKQSNDAQETEVTTGEVLNNVGRVKRKSQLKAENKLKAIGEELLASAPTEVTEFVPKNHIIFEPPLCIADYETQCLSDLKEFGKGFCKQKICRFSCSSFAELEQHLFKCKFIPKPGYHCTFCRTKKVFATQQLALQHVTKKHSPLNESDDFSKSDNSDCNIDDAESLSSDDCSSGVDSNKAEDEGGENDNDDDDPQNADNSDDYARERKKSRKKIKREKNKLKQSNQTDIRPTIGDKKSLYPVRAPKSKDIINKRWKQFTKQNFSDKILFDYGAANFSVYDENNDNLEKLLPRQKDSMKFTLSTKTEINTIFGIPEPIDNWIQLKRFETLTEQSDNFTFIGAPIKKLAWAPLPQRSGRTQYLAICYRKDIDKYTRAFNPKIVSTLILIYKINLNARATTATEQTNGTATESKVQLHYAIRIPDGPVHCFAFLPSGGYAPTANRLGLLAVGTACSDLQVYALPLTIIDEKIKTESKDDVDTSKDIANSLSVLDLKPVFVLSLDLSTKQRNDAEETIQCTCLKWSEFRAHNFIFCGFSNGFVGIWDVCDNENVNLNSFTVNTVRHFVPLNYFFCGERGVRDLALHYDTMGPRWLAVCAFARKAVIYDVRDLTSPRIVRDDFPKNIVSALEWPVMSESVALCMGDAIINNGTSVLVRSPLSIGFTTCKIENMLAAVNQAKYNPCQSVYYSVTDNGDILFHTLRELNCGLRKKMPFSAKAISTLDIKSLIGEKIIEHGDKNKSSLYTAESNYKEKYGLVFGPIIKFSPEVDNAFRSVTRLPPLNMRRFTRINCLSCNMNENANKLVAFGFENGLLRIMHFNELQYFT